VIGTLQLRAVPRARAASEARSGERLLMRTMVLAVAGLPLIRPNGPGGTAPEDVLILLALAATLLWAGRSGQPLRFAYGAPVAIFITGGALGALNGPVPGAGAVAIVQDIVLLAWCWAFMNVASHAERLRALLTAWAYSSIGWVLLLFVGLVTGATFLTGQVPREGSRTALTFGDPNVSANYYVISMMIICATGRPRRRSTRVAAYALFVAAILSTGSNSGVVSLVVATSLATVLGIHRRSGTIPAIAACAFLAGAGLLLTSTVSLKSLQQKAAASHFAFLRDGLGRGEVSVGQRGTLLHESLGLYTKGGILGTGPVSTKPRLAAEMAPFVKEAHNDYVAALTERGVLGAFGLILFMAGLVLRGVSLARTRLGPSFSAVVVRPNAVIGALAGTMTTSAVYELLHVRHVWTLYALIAALVLWGRQ